MAFKSSLIPSIVDFFWALIVSVVVFGLLSLVEEMGRWWVSGWWCCKEWVCDPNRSVVVTESSMVVGGGVWTVPARVVRRWREHRLQLIRHGCIRLSKSTLLLVVTPPTLLSFDLWLANQIQYHRYKKITNLCNRPHLPTFHIPRRFSRRNLIF